jgi:alanyl-tRNA synthetase
MFTTKKLYEENPGTLTCSAHVLDVLIEDQKTVVILDQTVFRPPTKNDPVKTIGVIESSDKAFHVTGVEEQDNAVHHVGTFESEPFELDEIVTCVLNEEYTKEMGIEVQ